MEAMDYAMTDADALQRYARSADPDAFRELVQRYEQLVFSVCVRRLGCSADADDAAQQTFLKLARAASGIRGSVAAWLHTTATRTAIDLGRQQTTRRRHEADAAQFRADVRAATPHDLNGFGDEDGFDPAQQAQWRELSAQLDEAVLELPAAQRRLIVDVYFQGRTQREVAEATGKSQARVCRQLKDAVAALRSALAKRGVMMPVAALAAGLGVVQEAAAAPSPVLSLEFTKVGLAGWGTSALEASTGGSSFLGHAASRLTQPVHVAWSNAGVWTLIALAVLGLLIAAAAFFGAAVSDGALSQHTTDTLADAQRAFGYR